MGNDIYYSGNLKQTELQEKVISFVKTYDESGYALHITPSPNLYYPTKKRTGKYVLEGTDAVVNQVHHQIVGSDGKIDPFIEMLYDNRQELITDHPNYPFNFFGTIPYLQPGMFEYGHFIFDRSDDGRLVRFERLPDSYGIHFDVSNQIHEKDSQLIPDENLEILQSQSPPENQVVIKDGGYHRMPRGDISFPLLLHVVKLRWWPEIELTEDYSQFKIVADIICKHELSETLINESLRFDECYDIFMKEYHKDHPRRR